MFRQSSLVAHTDRILCAAFTPDGRTLVTGSFDRTVKLWSTDTWRERLTLLGHSDAVWCIAVSPDGRTLATGGGAWKCPGEVKVWSIASGEEIANIVGFEGTVWSLAYSPDGKLLAAGCSGGKVHLWETSAAPAPSKFKSNFGTVQPPSSFQAHESGVRCLAFSPDSMSLATGSASGTIRTWSAASWQRLGAFTAHDGDVRAIHFSTDGRMIASGGGDRAVRIWSALTRAKIASLKAHTGEVKTVAFAPSGQWLASGGDDKSIKLWDANSWQELTTLHDHTGQVSALAFAPSGRQLVSCGWDQTVKVWDLSEPPVQDPAAASAAKPVSQFKSAYIGSSAPKSTIDVSAKAGSAAKIPSVTDTAAAGSPTAGNGATANPDPGPTRDTTKDKQIQALLDAVNAASAAKPPGPTNAAQPATEPIIPGYEVLEELGRGGMGVVYKARHVRMNRIAALKVMDPRSLGNPVAVARFYREIQAIAQLAHPNIIMAYDANEANGHHYLAMEFVEGIDLAKMVHQQGRLPVEQACDFIRQAALGLQHAFERGLIHRDIKPSNLLVTWALRPDARTASTGRPPTPGAPAVPPSPAATEPVVKILDMGLALLHQPAAVEGPQGVGDGLTKEGKVVGTPDYMAPEQWVNAHNVDIRADLYSLGCTFYFLLTGQAPFPGNEPMEKMLKHHIDPPTPVEQLRPDVPASVAAVVDRLLKKRPEERYATPAEVVAALL